MPFDPRLDGSHSDLIERLHDLTTLTLAMQAEKADTAFTDAEILEIAAHLDALYLPETSPAYRNFWVELTSRLCELGMEE